MKASNSYNKKKGSFSSYAWKRLGWYMVRAFKNEAFPSFRIPENKIKMKGDDVDKLTPRELWTYNASRFKTDLSCLSNILFKEDEEITSDEFVFFK